ncbi:MULTISPECIES: hypothetical protein [Actinomadura]|uniref:Uncharacterized protein n=1 Tax=Actinomadura litoris TaxID=2678616 RepID=A0A7K1L7D1_9ACTN|nr:MULTISPECIES: hypothetical protein [Actinomadura]MBT2209485.1 hypothetical protein [Actinomadura sp. NEAU-AAG7]MUN40176.1 hypothetical protein [Actinomadura litoris]
MADTRDLRVPPAPVGRLARLVVIALGLVGFVAAPAGAPASATSVTSVTSVTSAAAKAPARGRTADRHRDGHAETTNAAEAAATAAARHTTAAPPHVSHAALPASELQVGPPPAWLDRPARAPSRPSAAFGDAPRGRSPPASTGI